jgi:predicted ester cyclase
MKTLLALLAISCVFLSSCMKKEASGPSADQMRIDSIRNYNMAGYKAVGEMFTSGKFDGLGKYMNETYIEHQMMPGQKPGLAGLKEMMAGFRMAFPDMKYTTDHIYADTDMIWAHFTMTGTNTGSFMGMPPTGKKFTASGMDLIKLDANHKAIEHWGYMDEHKMMQDLGMAPPDAAMPPPGGDAKMAPPEKKG